MQVIEGKAQKSLVVRDMFHDDCEGALLVNLTAHDLGILPHMDVVRYNSKQDVQEDFLRWSPLLDKYRIIVFYANDDKESISWWKSFTDNLDIECIVTIQNNDIEEPIAYDV